MLLYYKHVFHMLWTKTRHTVDTIYAIYALCRSTSKKSLIVNSPTVYYYYYYYYYSSECVSSHLIHYHHQVACPLLSIAVSIT